MQHHMLPTFSDTTVGGGGGRAVGMVKEEKETNVLLLKTVSVFSLIFQDWGQMNAVAAYAISLPICNVHA